MRHRSRTMKPQGVDSMLPTEHPYVVRIAGICGGRPTSKGSRIAISHIAQLYKAGDTVEEILQAHPHLQAAAVCDVISYYLDHQPEMEGEITTGRLEAVLKKEGVTMDDRGFIWCLRFGIGRTSTEPAVNSMKRFV
jgi:uncharacterized protein (DUF433 family)